MHIKKPTKSYVPQPDDCALEIYYKKTEKTTKLLSVELVGFVTLPVSLVLVGFCLLYIRYIQENTLVATHQ